MKQSLYLTTALIFAAPLYGQDLVPLEDSSNIPTQKNTQTISYEDYFNRGTDALRKGEIATAIFNLEKSKQRNQHPPQIHFNLGVAYEANGQIDEAIEAFKDAILQRLDYPRAHHQLAKLLQRKGLIEQAIIHYEQAIRYDENLIDPCLTVARLLCEQERFDDSLEYFDRYVKQHTTDVGVRFEYANALNTAYEPEKAVEIYLELLKERPNDAGILYNTAYTLKKLGRIQEAMPYYEAALKKNPNHSEAHFSLGLAYLVTGDFTRGWPEYEWRWQRNTQLTPRNFNKPQWDGSSLDGKTILLHAEQGLGDTFQFIRYAKLIKEQYNATIIFASQKPLYTIMSHCCPYIDQVATLDAIPAAFDVHAPLLSLPFILKSDEHTIPKDIPYIVPNEKLVEEWKQKLGTDTKFKVGICWQGNSKYSTPFLRSVVAAKSIALKQLAPLGSVENITFYSLQKENGVDQLSQLPEQFKLVTFDDTFDQDNGRFMDTAAVIKNLDLVITIDTSICHLAAAIGTPVWTFIPEPPDWRWLLNRTDTPWYPNMRLFRQKKSGDWESVIAEVATELSLHIAQKQTPTPQTTFPAKETSLLHQLRKEHDQLSLQFKKRAQRLSSLNIAANDPQFVAELRKLYLITELQKNVNEKITTLEESR